ncbi:hypothetical protein HYX15_02460 [Candidatus Woesearchaeota archaeon]|nr:hypothetical protein [Candidatus Woesearchaeota archaeon]
MAIGEVFDSIQKIKEQVDLNPSIKINLELKIIGVKAGLEGNKWIELVDEEGFRVRALLGKEINEEIRENATISASGSYFKGDMYHRDYIRITEIYGVE